MFNFYILITFQISYQKSGALETIGISYHETVEHLPLFSSAPFPTTKSSRGKVCSLRRARIYPFPFHSGDYRTSVCRLGALAKGWRTSYLPPRFARGGELAPVRLAPHRETCAAPPNAPLRLEVIRRGARPALASFVHPLGPESPLCVSMTDNSYRTRHRTAWGSIFSPSTRFRSRKSIVYCEKLRRSRQSWRSFVNLIDLGGVPSIELISAEFLRSWVSSSEHWELVGTLFVTDN